MKTAQRSVCTRTASRWLPTAMKQAQPTPPAPSPKRARGILFLVLLTQSRSFRTGTSAPTTGLKDAIPSGLFRKAKAEGVWSLAAASRTCAAADTFASAFARRAFVHRFAAAGTALLAATGHLVDRRPGAAFRFPLAAAAMPVAFLDVFGLTFLFAAVTAFVTSWHT
jgi:hypothetical protein